MTSNNRRAWVLYVGLFLAGLVVYGSASFLIRSPGYMDAEYYFATAKQLAQGKGFLEPFVWNYLSDPSGLPAPSHTYWMPLASLLAAASMTGLGTTFRSAQIVSVVLAAAVPVLAARSSVSLGGERRTAWLAGGLALLPGFFMPYFLTTDTFALFAVIGGASLWQMGEAVGRPAAGRWAAVGVLIGMAHLARADGVLLWGPAVYALWASKGNRIRHFGFALVGYAALMIPWWVRNVQVTGGLLAPGAARALWLLNYDELFSFPASQLTAARWWAAGPMTLLTQRLEAGWTNLQTILAVNGYVLLLPLMILGACNRRRHPLVRAGAVYSVLLYLFMSLVFPFAGARGGFFHSSAALMPVLWALAAVGIDQAAAWIAPRRSWDEGRARGLWITVAVLLAAALSAWALAGKAGLLGAASSFDRNLATYRQAATYVDSPNESTVVAVNDPPGFFLATGISAVAIPNGSEDTLRQVAARYGVDWIVLEADHPRGLDALYQNPTSDAWLGPPRIARDPAGKPVFIFKVAPVAEDD